MACKKTELTREEVAKKLYAELVCEVDWLAQTHGLHLQVFWTDEHETAQEARVTRYYEASFSPWPLGRSAYDVDREHRVHNITHNLTVSLRDYWRLALTGRGI